MFFTPPTEPGLGVEIDEDAISGTEKPYVINHAIYLTVGPLNRRGQPSELRF